METIGLFLAIGLGFYLLFIRPQSKAKKQKDEMMRALAPGDRIMLGSGVYGTIRHIGEKQAVIEISPGVDMTVLRIAIHGVVQTDEEEFEYSSDLDEDAGDQADFADLESAFAAPASVLGDDQETALQDEAIWLVSDTGEDTDQDEK